MDFSPHVLLPNENEWYKAAYYKGGSWSDAAGNLSSSSRADVDQGHADNALGFRAARIVHRYGIYRWDTRAIITDKDAVPGVDLNGMDLRYAGLVGANLSRAVIPSWA